MSKTAIIDGDMDDLIGHTWMSVVGYPKHSIGKQEDQYVHITVMEYHLGRKLIPPECVHHIDYNKLNNKLENLLLCPNNKAHKRIHAIQDVINDGYDPNLVHYCTYHKQYETKDRFSTNYKSWNGLHNVCREGTNEYRRINRQQKVKHV